MQRDLKLEKNVVYPAKVDRYPGGDRYEGGPLAPHHAVPPLPQDDMHLLLQRVRLTRRTLPITSLAASISQ